MQIERDDNVSGLDCLRVAIFDLHGVIIGPGQFHDQQVSDQAVNKIERRGPSEVLRKVPFDVPLRSKTSMVDEIKAKGDALLEWQLRWEYLEGAGYSHRYEVRDTIIDLACSGVKVSVCSSLDRTAENALRSYLRDKAIWSRLNPQLPAILRADKADPALAYKIYSVEEALRIVEQMFLYERYKFQKEHPGIFLPPFSRRFAVVEDNINIAIPTQRVMRLRQMPPTRYYIPVDSKDVHPINKELWPESVRDMPDEEDNVIYDPDLSIMREDFGLD